MMGAWENFLSFEEKCAAEFEHSDRTLQMMRIIKVDPEESKF